MRQSISSSSRTSSTKVSTKSCRSTSVISSSNASGRFPSRKCSAVKLRKKSVPAFWALVGISTKIWSSIGGSRSRGVEVVLCRDQSPEYRRSVNSDEYQDTTRLTSTTVSYLPLLRVFFPEEFKAIIALEIQSLASAAGWLLFAAFDMGFCGTINLYEYMRRIM